MHTVKIEDLEKEKIISTIQNGSIFLYPTETVYGIGCNALKKESVQKIREMKKTGHSFSVIAPSKKWMFEHLRVRHKEFLKKLPGPYTLIFEKKEKGFLNECSGTEKLGVRIPRHPFTDLVKKAGVPFVTTSANISGERTITRISDIPQHFKKSIDIAIDGGILDNPPSTIFDLTGEKPKKIR